MQTEGETMAAPTAPRQPIAETWAVSHQAPLWVAVALYAVAHSDKTGHAPMRAGQLRAAIAPHSSAATLSQAIQRAIRAGWLHPESSAWCLRLDQDGVRHGS